MAVSPSRLAAVRQHLFGDAESRSDQLESVYYDTAGGDLRRNRMAVRVRRDSGGGLTRTIKAAGDPDNPFRRTELERPITGPAPEVTTPEVTAPEVEDLRPLLPAAEYERVCKAGLMPVFSTSFERTTRLARGRDSRGEAYAIELALDDGRIQAGGAGRRISELELELKEGTMLGLYECARDMLDAEPDAGPDAGPEAGIRGLLMESKAARAWRLASGAPPDVHREPLAPLPDPLPRSQDASAVVAFQAIARSCIAHWMLNYPNLIEAGSPEAVHWMRAAIQHLREALSAFRAVLVDAPETQLAALAAFYDQLGDLHRLDLAIGEMGALCTAEDKALEADRGARWKAVVACATTPSHFRMLLDIAIWVEGGPWRKSPNPKPAG